MAAHSKIPTFLSPSCHVTFGFPETSFTRHTPSAGQSTDAKASSNLAQDPAGPPCASSNRWPSWWSGIATTDTFSVDNLRSTRLVERKERAILSEA